MVTLRKIQSNHRIQPVDSIELNLLIEAIKLRYGYDFTNYSKSSLKRRVNNIVNDNNLSTISELQSKILHEEHFFSQVLNDITVTVTELFRDPKVYEALHLKVFPMLRTYPHIKIWHAGCSTGEEVYSLAILLKEANLYDKCQIYATDINKSALKKAKEGVFDIDLLRVGGKNYFNAKAEHSLKDYFTFDYDMALINSDLKKNIVFSDHNLVTDSVFGEMNLVLCRNVMIYFNKKLQNDVLKLLADSLVRKGFLCLGSKESIMFSAVEDNFKTVAKKERIFQKVK